MIVEISLAVIAACFVLIVIRLYSLSIRIEEAIRRFEELLSRLENDIRPILYDVKYIISDIKGITEIAKEGSKKIDHLIEAVMGPFQTLSIFLKAVRAGFNAFFRKERG
ncbi:MAG: hypothetical protein A2Y48_07355 [Nitrospirae bacterium RIFCSPLOW2_12_42_9]|nr:MAG: hypothetical protein A2035_02855 [Nitrospirae bacterium GWA2_42_11]OGW62861.1 MAG: hypothetical protein A2Y48_07355 [Nitrospirae bacterium RIFCSPLOW2_12_42_9]OGW69414.1 MAG: hypothetical protein A3J72_07115 [Nitrospirae bacterium RIFCSPHIGHO2_02_FULL_40_19]HBI24093.1 hypothetical protein [Nitrospiraceae bacterium]